MQKMQIEQLEQKADNLIGSHPPEDMSARARAPFPQNTYSVQDWIKRAVNKLGYILHGPVIFPHFLSRLNGAKATLSSYWSQQSDKWAARAVMDHANVEKATDKKRLSRRLIDTLNELLAMDILGFQEEDCVAMCGKCKEEHNFALSGIHHDICTTVRFITVPSRHCYPTTPNVCREGMWVRHSAYARALYEAQPTLAIENQWNHGFGWKHWEDDEEYTVPPPDNFLDEDTYIAALRIQYLHAARVIARFMKSVKKTVK